ncbi:MAG: DUF5666 domain-containing protein [Candidatus Levyibacteriota bacterium]
MQNIQKLILPLIILSILFIPVTQTHAASTVTPTTDPQLNKQINQLKDKIASRVSELNLVEKRGIIGVVSSVSSNQINVTDMNGTALAIDVDEITKFTSPSNKATFGISDLAKGTKVSILGLYNKESKRILARFIDTQVDPTRYEGVIASIDKKNDNIIVETADQKQVTVSIDTTTKISSSDNGAALVRYGFSKLNVGDRVFVVGYPDKKDTNMLDATRIIDFQNVPKDPNIVVSAPTPTVSAAPTSAGAKGLKPVK